MTFTSNVQPRRRVRAKAVRGPWECKCGRQNHEAVPRCYVCLAVRP